ncbi:MULTISPECIES: stage III sporulation protein AD [Desulfosporosinus]|uniref:Stage III sporulation protein AD n=2 Tax=Desulfosporosinus TaxID=79206 RepID=A0A1M5YZ87_9FIRM|nr:MULTISPECIES: stage III sporulation protein AD [Desulfosporosinus]MDA8223195.1 stage III sporulation protein AD [Desulfitobacterium hafniense]MCO1600056.1 stage III sporulation protein AD [Desulfosporosinus nitroreducens]MCO5387993.1 stage III sporulation protein AD [Desulfosporosinus sp.]MDO0822914.1 stage III sporulation protein AD [Desulfosporosinus nitroreducens]SHI17382.1 stage III sporulation protein AD [Desulfosporosinus lacus DSM 15449]
MEIWQIVGLALIVTVFSVVLKQIRPEIALQLSILAGASIFILILSKVRVIVDLLQTLADQANISSYYLLIILKIVGVAYLAEFGAQICRDAGEGALATKIELAAKVGVIILAIPIIVAITESLVRLVP